MNSLPYTIELQVGNNFKLNSVLPDYQREFLRKG